MPHYYARSGTPISSMMKRGTISACVSSIAMLRRWRARPSARWPSKAVRKRAAPPATQFGRFMVLHESGASTAPVSTVVNTLAALASRVVRTCRYSSSASQAKPGRHRPDTRYVQAGSAACASESSWTTSAASWSTASSIPRRETLFCCCFARIAPHLANSSWPPTT